MNFVDFCDNFGVTKEEVPVLFEYWLLLRCRELRAVVLPAALEAAR